MKDNSVLVSVPIVFKKIKEDFFWFVVYQGGAWELPKTMVRRGESSVRASIRLMAEQGGMRAKVLEEVGRASGAAKISGRAITQKYLFYLMRFKDGGEVLGFEATEWLPYAQAVRKLAAKRDKTQLKSAKALYKEIDLKRRKARAAIR